MKRENTYLQGFYRLYASLQQFYSITEILHRVYILGWFDFTLR